MQELPAEKSKKRLVKVSVETNPYHGKHPEKRSVTELLQNSIILLDKPSGPTAHQVDAWVRDIFNGEKVGHAGTLDPKVTGILPLGIGQATKALSVLSEAGKEYVGVMKLHKSVGKKHVQKIFGQFVGTVTQLPPVRSAVKRRRRKREIYYLEVIEQNDTDVLFRVGCEAGTYVRTLCVDIGKKLGIGAHLAKLRRTKVGLFTEKELVNLQDVKDAYVFYQEGNPEDLKKILQPVERVFNHLPKIILRDSAIDAICHGATLAVPGVVEVETNISKNMLVALFSMKKEIVAIGNAKMSTEEIIDKDTGICVDPEKVFMNKGTYPAIWKKH
ncbi:MAG: RNA-guided pseudouridylation complex pseudouridine synthase subunit Cbf5 [Candidatus Thermoplasmatota archaeon]|nr:RNA-guided pseudouridylation complex pseudouridine synthase subunit Cbf5 [Candidatus Thermoplasmatota archaeon]